MTDIAQEPQSLSTTDGANSSGAAPSEKAEHFLLELTHIKASDVIWGGFLSLFLTDRRICMVFVAGPGVAIAASLAAGIVGSALASHAADKKLERLTDQAASVDDLLAQSPKSYAINYSEISSVKMSRTALPIGYSRMKIQSRNRNVSFAFRKKMFDEVVGVLRATLPPGAALS